MLAGNDGATARDFIAHELGRHELRNGGAEALTRVLAHDQLGQSVTALVLANRDVLHFRRNDAFARVMHLRNIHARPGAARVTLEIETQLGELGVCGAAPPVFGSQVRQAFGIVALGYPFIAQAAADRTDVDRYLRIGVRARGVVHEK